MDASKLKEVLRPEYWHEEVLKQQNKHKSISKVQYRQMVKYIRELPEVQRKQHEVFSINWEKGHGYKEKMLKVLKDKALLDYVETGLRQMIPDEMSGELIEVNVTTDSVALLTASKLSKETGVPILRILESWAEYGSVTIPEELERYAAPVYEDLALALTAAEYPVDELYRTFFESTKFPYVDDGLAVEYLLEESGTFTRAATSEYLTPTFSYDEYLKAGGEPSSHNNMYNAGCIDWEDIRLDNINEDKARNNTWLVDFLIEYAIDNPDKCKPFTPSSWIQARYDEVRDGIAN